MRLAPLLLAPVLVLGAAAPSPGRDQPVVLANDRVQLVFDARTGDWTGLDDRVDGVRLVKSGRATLLPAGRQVVDAGQAGRVPGVVNLAGDWLYTPTPPPESLAPEFRVGRFDAAAWAATPVPSRAGVGDDLLRDRVGSFWYRREFTVPADQGDDLALVIGAIDDFDVASVNGVRIGRTGAEASHHWETARFYPIPRGVVRADRPNVVLLRVTNGSGQGGIAGPVLVGPAGPLREAVDDGPATRSSKIEQGRDGGRQTLAFTEARDGLAYRVEWSLLDGSSRFQRRISVANLTDGEKLVRTVTHQTPPLDLGSDVAVIFPGSVPTGDQPTNAIEVGEGLRPRSDEPLVVVRDRASGRAVGSWYRSEDEFTPVDVTRSGDGLQVRHTQPVVVRIKPGGSATLGTEYFWIGHGDRDAAMSPIQEIYREIGLKAPDRAIPGLRSMVIYNGHPGGPPELGYRTYGGFSKVESYLPTLKSMGVDLLWFLPVWEHGDGGQWNLYSPFDHFQVSPLYGGAAGLKQLADRAAGQGIRLVFDLVPHGPPDVTELARAHPEYRALGPDGKPQYAWLQLAFDNAHPGWQDYFRRVAEFDAREFRAVGARVDCAAGGPLNWNPAVTDRPSRSSLFAGLGMTRAIREGFLRANPDTLVIPEEYTGANVYHGVADLTYDAQFYFLMADLVEQDAEPDRWAATLARFLHDQQQVVPPGGLKMRWISNHDTVSWTFQKKRPLVAYGVKRTRALLALCALIEGVPMLYQGDEDPAVYHGTGPSSVDFLRTVYAARKREPALRDGGADYQSVRADNGVFACRRTAGDQTALVLISFNPAAVRSKVTGAPAGTSRWLDVLGDGAGDALDLGAPVPMAPHQVRVLVPARP